MAVLKGGTAASLACCSAGCLVGSVCGGVLRGGELCVAWRGLHSPPFEPVEGAPPGFAKLAVKEVCS